VYCNFFNLIWKLLQKQTKNIFGEIKQEFFMNCLTF